MPYQVYVAVRLQPFDTLAEARDWMVSSSDAELKTAIIVRGSHVVDKREIGPCDVCRKPLYDEDGIIDEALENGNGFHAKCARAALELKEQRGYSPSVVESLKKYLATGDL